MKILTIRFENLNSLAGKWEINLASPEYSSSGIFAIVGSTGAGKSTILDAVSLALYGRTPRIKQISKSANDIMTRHTGECSAELEFISARGHFRCHWSQHRARRQSTGDLQQPRHEITDAETGNILETKIKNVAQKVIEVTGMDFDQFTRSMLLAQGDFNKFLQASADERAPILEQITGTAIYSHISRKVHELTNSSRQRLELLKQELGSFNLLSDDEEKETTNRLEALASEANSLQKNLAVLNEQRSWLQSIENLRKSCVVLEEQLQILVQEKEKFAPSLARLERAASAEKIAGHHGRIRELKIQQETEEKALVSVRENLRELSAKASSLEERSGLLIKHKSEATEAYEKSHPLFREVTHLDQLVNRLKTDLSEQKKLHNEIGSAITAKTKDKAELERLQTKNVSETEEARKYLEANPDHQHLAHALSGIAEQIRALKQAEKQKTETKKLCEANLGKLSEQKTLLVSIQKSKADNERELAGRREKLQESQNTLETFASLNDLFNRRQNLYEQLHDMQQLKQSNLELTGLQDQKKRISKSIGERDLEEKKQKELLEQQEKELTRCNYHVEREEEIVFLATKVKSLEKERNLLREGHACPLCGATDHPYAVNLPEQLTHPQERLKKAKEAQRVCRDAIEQTRTLISRLSLEREKDTDLIAAIDANMQKHRTRLAGVIEDDDTVNITAVIETKALHLQKSLDETEKTIQKREKLQALFSSLTEQITVLSSSHNRYEREEEACALKIQNLSVEIGSQKEQLEKLTGTVTSTLQGLQARFPDFAQDTEETDSVQAVYQRLEKKAGLYESAKIKYENGSQVERQLSTRLQHLQESLDELSDRSRKIELKAEELNTELGQITERRFHLFGEKIVAEEELKLKTQLNLAESALEQHNHDLAELTKQKTSLQEREKLYRESTANRIIELRNRRQEFELLLQANDFSSEEDFLNSCMGAEKKADLEQQAKLLETRTVETKTLLNRKKSELQTEREKNLTELTQEKLTEQISEQSELLAARQQETGALQKTLEQHRKSLAIYEDKRKTLSRLEQDYGYWWQLHNLIGSADGKKFRNFAQGITFEIMIRHANHQLVRMSDRYLLIRDKTQPLDLHVVDNYQGGEVRTTNNLSGGESFIVSLSLALGLASMAGNNIRVDTLFLDEGFGTLDEESLDVALDTLSSLQQEGKLIGIISHVHLLKERIATQLNVHAGANGRSTISGPGVKAL